MRNETFEQRDRATQPVPTPAVGKAARVLEEVAVAPGCGISELARQTGLGKSTVHSLVNALLAEGLLARGEGRNGLVLGPRLMVLANAARDQAAMAAAEAAFAALRPLAGETVFFGRVEGELVRIFARREGEGSLILSAPVGSTVPALAGALGKAYLATLDQSAAERYVAGRPLPQYTPRSVTERSAYLAGIERARQAGYAIERGEYLPGIAAAASATRSADDTYLVWVVGIESVLDEAALDALGRQACVAALAARKRLGGTPPRRRSA